MPACQFWPIFCTKRWKTLERHDISKIANKILENRQLRGSVPNFKTKALAVWKIKGKENWENKHRKTTSFMYNFVQKTNATKQLWWHFMPTSPLNFSHGFYQNIRFKRNFKKKPKKWFSSKVQFLAQEWCLKPIDVRLFLLLLIFSFELKQSDNKVYAFHRCKICPNDGSFYAPWQHRKEAKFCSYSTKNWTFSESLWKCLSTRSRAFDFGVQFLYTGRAQIPNQDSMKHTSIRWKVKIYGVFAEDRACKCNVTAQQPG